MVGEPIILLGYPAGVGAYFCKDRPGDCKTTFQYAVCSFGARIIKLGSDQTFQHKGI